jgi:hypothetical protein
VLGAGEPLDWLARLRERCRAQGLNLVLPVDVARFDAEALRRGGVTLAECWATKGATMGATMGAAIVIADGGPGFFEGFSRASAASGGRDPSARGASDPLDGFTVARVRDIAGEVFDDPAGASWRVLFPFAQEPPVLPFQQLGMAAGLPAPGPLGLQIHPTYGPWWAYRALLLSAQSLPEPAKARVPSGRGGPSLQMKAERRPPIFSPLPAGRGKGQGEGPTAWAASSLSHTTSDPCGSCARPCVEACPAGAVAATGFDFVPCSARRLAEGSPCARTCVARLACPVGTAERYGVAQLAFHMDASLVSLRRHVAHHP